MRKDAVLTLRKDRDATIVAISPHVGDLGSKILHSLDGEKCVLVRVGDTERVPRLDLFRPSKKANEFERAQENDEKSRRFIDILLARRGQIGLHERPLIEDGLTAVTNLWMYQNPVKPLSWLPYGFDVMHPAFEAMIRDCTNQAAVWKCEQWRDMPKSERFRTLLPAQRVLDGGFSSPTFQAMIDGKNSVEKWLDEGRRIIVETMPGVSENGARLLFLTFIQSVIWYKRSGGKRRVILIIDEALNWSLVDGYLLRAMAELLKFGLEIWVSVQTLNFEEESTIEGLLACCYWWEVYRVASPKVLDICSRFMLRTDLDPHRIHHVEVRKQQFHDGYYSVDTEQTNTGGAKTIGKQSGWSLAQNKGTSIANTEGGSYAIAENGGIDETRTITDRDRVDDKTGLKISETISAVSEIERDGRTVTDTHNRAQTQTTQEGETRGINGSNSEQVTESWGKTLGKQYLSQYRIEEQTIEHFMPVGDQLTIEQEKLRQALQTLQVGERFVNAGGRVFREKIEMLPEPYSWVPREKVVQKIIDRVMSQPFYEKPSSVQVPRIDEEPPKGAAARYKEKRGWNS